MISMKNLLRNLHFCYLIAVLAGSVAAQSFELVSVSTDRKSFGSFYNSTAPVIGGTGADDGRYVAFVSSAAGLGGATGRKRQIIWRDRKLGVTRLISIGADGKDGNGDSFAPAISADGLSVAYESYATNLVPIDTNGVRDIFVWNSRNGVTTAVSTGPGEIETNAESFEPTISGDGRFIAYTSSASNITPGVEGTSTVNVYLKDMSSGVTKLISIDPKTKKGVGGSRPSISDDGSKIAFYSFASTLVENDKNGLWDIFVFQSGNPKLNRISLTMAGGERDQGTESASRVISPTISGDGRFVVYSTTASNVFPGDVNKAQDVFWVDTASGGILPLSVGPNMSAGTGDSPIGQGERIAISYDGMQVAFTTKAASLGGNLVLQDLSVLLSQAGSERPASPTTELNSKSPLSVISKFGSEVGSPSISRSGNCVVFGNNAKLDDRFPTSGIFVTCRNRATH